MSYEFQVDVEQLNEKTAVINLVGDITIFADKLIHDAYDEISKEGVCNVIFNFSKDDVICTPGIAILIDVIVEASKKNQKLLMALPNSHFQKVFYLMGITQYVDIFNSLEEAKQHAL